ncbi:hypothetical protein APHAL10511_004237 [Amanita phalloides]|nr:hypothetical protein APHAL10511_004237 [Amanita phalloides]
MYYNLHCAIRGITDQFTDEGDDVSTNLEEEDKPALTANDASIPPNPPALTSPSPSPSPAPQMLAGPSRITARCPLPIHCLDGIHNNLDTIQQSSFYCSKIIFSLIEDLNTATNAQDARVRDAWMAVCNDISKPWFSRFKKAFPRHSFAPTKDSKAHYWEWVSVGCLFKSQPTNDALAQHFTLPHMSLWSPGKVPVLQALSRFSPCAVQVQYIFCKKQCLDTIFTFS